MPDFKLNVVDMITTNQFRTLEDLFGIYNLRLFEGALPECILNMSRKANTYGFFAADRWADSDSPDVKVHEISLNPDFLQRPFIEWHSTFVHEMCHLWQQEFGKPSRAAYHNKEWAQKMVDVGLMPSDTGMPGGKKTGQKVSHYVVSGGRFEGVFNGLDEYDLERFRLRYLPSFSLGYVSGRDGEEEDPGGDGEGSEGDTGSGSRSGQRKKYSCSCGNNVWGRGGLCILCEDCGERFLES